LGVRRNTANGVTNSQKAGRKKRERGESALGKKRGKKWVCSERGGQRKSQPVGKRSVSPALAGKKTLVHSRHKGEGKGREAEGENSNQRKQRIKRLLNLPGGEEKEEQLKKMLCRKGSTGLKKYAEEASGFTESGEKGSKRVWSKGKRGGRKNLPQLVTSIRE